MSKGNDAATWSPWDEKKIKLVGGTNYASNLTDVPCEICNESTPADTLCGCEHCGQMFCDKCNSEAPDYCVECVIYADDDKDEE